MVGAGERSGRRRISKGGAAVALLLLATGCQRSFDVFDPGRVPEAAVDAAQRAAAQKIATSFYEGCRDGRFQPLGDEATQAMCDALTPEKQKATYESIKGMFGDYTAMDYVETWKDRTFRIYRFKGHFSKGNATPEIRVVMDEAGKLTGFWLKPWSDTLR